MISSLTKKFNKVGKKTEGILSVFQKAKEDLAVNIVEYEQLEVELTEEIMLQEQLLEDIAGQKNSAKHAMYKFTEWLGE